MSVTLTLLTLVVAFADWIAVSRRAMDPAWVAARRAEYVAKPLTMVFLVAAALAIADAHHCSAYLVVTMVAALVLSLAGDVFLMLPEDSPATERNFVFGLGAFLLAHVAYIAAFVRLHEYALTDFRLHAHAGYAISFFLTGLFLAGAMFATVGLPIRRAAAEEDEALAVPVLAYVTVISLMVVAAWWTGDMRIIPGALLFAASDAMIGWTRFVRRDWELDVPIIVTYHLAQILLVLGLVRR